ncbi:MAG: alpha-L-rhamnosidase N-terminal domain-containing protein, partial [Conexivisphaerales archaeon]
MTSLSGIKFEEERIMRIMLLDTSYFDNAQLDWQAKWITKKDPKTFESNGDWMVKKFVQSYGMYFRKRFEVNLKDISKATVHVSGIGYYELSINGQRVGD